MEELKSSNWMPWQRRRMLAVLRQVQFWLDNYIANEIVPAKEGQPTEILKCVKGTPEMHSDRLSMGGDAEMRHNDSVGDAYP